MIRRRPRSPLLPYSTLFRSRSQRRGGQDHITGRDARDLLPLEHQELAVSQVERDVRARLRHRRLHGGEAAEPVETESAPIAGPLAAIGHSPAGCSYNSNEDV